MALDDGACDPLLFQRGAFFQQQIKHLRVIHITSYSILNVHQVFMLIEISKIHIGGYAIIKTGLLLKIASTISNVIGVDHIA